jgi:hypothetical protein
MVKLKTERGRAWLSRLPSAYSKIRMRGSAGCTGLAMKTLNRAILGAHRTASAFLLGGFVLCNFVAQANVPYSKIGGWSVAYLEVGNLSGCRATAQFPDQTIFQMVQIQSGTTKVG